MSYIFEDGNYKLNYSKLDLLEEKCSNIANRNTEIIKISVGMYLDPEINRLISKKNKLTGYEYISAQDSIQSKMLELTELFPDRQYQVMLLCKNDMNFYQSSLNLMQDAVTLDMLDEESWYQEAMERTIPSISFQSTGVLYCRSCFRRTSCLRFRNCGI